MPTYEYRCKECGEHLEVVQSFKDEPLTDCPRCGGDLRKVFGNIGIAFKGSGFYKTDSRSGAGKSKSASAEGGSSSTGSGSSSGASESKSESGSGSGGSTSEGSGGSKSEGSGGSKGSESKAASAS